MLFPATVIRAVTTANERSRFHSNGTVLSWRSSRGLKLCSFHPICFHWLACSHWLKIIWVNTSQSSADTTPLWIRLVLRRWAEGRGNRNSKVMVATFCSDPRYMSHVTIITKCEFELGSPPCPAVCYIADGVGWCQWGRQRGVHTWGSWYRGAWEQAFMKKWGNVATFIQHLTTSWSGSDLLV